MIGYYAPGVETVLIVLCLTCGVGMFTAVLMAAVSGWGRYALPGLPRRHDAAPSKFPFGRRPAGKSGAA